MNLVSVIIPCFNSGLTINQTVDSVREQTYPNIEIIIIDDGSDDPVTLEILKNIADVMLIQQPNSGLPAARNRGCEAASGDFILPLDSDDWLETDAVYELVSVLEKTPHASFSFSNIYLEGDRRGVLKKQYNYFEQLFLNQIPYSILMPKELWSKVGGYDPTMQNGYEDWEFNIRLGSEGHFGVVAKKPLFHYRVRSTGMLLSKSNKMHTKLWSEIQEKHNKIYNLKMLVKTWTVWRFNPSTYPLIAYFFWFLLHKFLPKNVFNVAFGLLLNMSQSRRISRKLVDSSIKDS